MRGRPLSMLSAMLLGALTGCSRDAPAGQYHAFAGTVTARNAATGEIVVALDQPRRPDRAVEACVLNQHSEVYINDRLSSIDAVRVGDRVTVIGYREPNPRLRQFVISYARITRPETAPALPEFLAGALRPTTSQSAER